MHNAQGKVIYVGKSRCLRDRVSQYFHGTHDRKTEKMASSVHDFRFVKGNTHSNLIFDVVVPFEEKRSETQIREAIADEISGLDPSYFCVITVDRA